MDTQELFSIKGKTTMRIGGVVRRYAMLQTQADCEQAVRSAAEWKLPLCVLGSGSNTIFADGTVEVFAVQIGNTKTDISENRITVGAGKNLAMLINELAAKNLDLSALTGIPGTVGGALFGNAGQGPKGVWIDSFVVSVTALIDGAWKTLSKDDCRFRYRESFFKDQRAPSIIWEAELSVPTRPAADVQATIQGLLQKRIETQPHLKTAGSCFKAVGGVPAWQLIDKAGLRGCTIGGVEVSTKHANFLINAGEATYADAKGVVEKVRAAIPEELEVEMRFIENDGSLAY